MQRWGNSTQSTAKRQGKGKKQRNKTDGKSDGNREHKSKKYDILESLTLTGQTGRKEAA